MEKIKTMFDKLNHEMVEIFFRLLGSIAGSTLSVVFRDRSKNGIMKQLIIGTVIGFIGAPVAIDKLRLGRDIDGLLAGGTVAGICGFVLLKLFFSIDFKKIVEGKYKK